MPTSIDSSPVRDVWPLEEQGPDHSQCSAWHLVEDPRPSLERPARGSEQSSFSMSGFG